MPGIPAKVSSQTKVGIRPALSQDLPRILEIEKLTFGEQWDYFQFKASLNEVFLVAVEPVTAEVLGFLVACCCQVTRRGIILRVAVHPDYQGRGIATRLLEELFRELRQRDLDEVELDVDVIKAGALRLYEKMGFKVVETFSPDAEEDEAFFLMRKKLEPVKKKAGE
jgi:[ribosomal protein S18]-alanine N-acetyltransferase